MKWNTWLAAIILLELLGAAILIHRASNRPSPPLPNLQKLAPITASAIEAMQKAAARGGSTEWRKLAEAYLGSGYYVAAEQCFHQAWELAPNDLQVLYSRGFCLERVGRTSEAIQVLRQVARSSPGQLRTTCWYQIGRCFLRQEDPVNAETAFRRISDFPPAAYQLAKLLTRSGRPGEAVPFIDALLETLPNSLKLIQVRRHAAIAMDDTKLASDLRDREERAEYQLMLEYSQSFITMFSTQFGMQSLLSKAIELKKSGTVEQRKAALDEVLEIIRSNNLWQYRSVFLAAAYVELGLENFDEVSRLVAEIRTYSQGGADLLELEGLALAKQGKTAEAVQIWQRALRMSPSREVISEIVNTGILSDEENRSYNCQAQILIALEAFRSNRLKESKAALMTAIELDPDRDQSWFYLAEIERSAGAVDKAAIAYSKCIHLSPEHGRAHRGKRTLGL